MAAVMSPKHPPQLPWYRQFWPWVLIGLPATAVIASLTTVYIAVKGRDSLVVDDYYKAGLAINQELGRDRLAGSLGVNARLQVEDGLLTVDLTALQSLDESALVLRLRHPTLAARDLELTLSRIDTDRYSVRLPELAQAYWHVELAPDHRAWRLTGRWAAPAERSLRLSPAVLKE
jgi:hypothetical protein